MTVITRDERSWTIRVCPICGAAAVIPEDYVCTCVCALESVEVVPASRLAGAVDENERLRGALERIGRPAGFVSDDEDAQMMARIARDALRGQ
jgi:hypothetical protein